MNSYISHFSWIGLVVAGVVVIESAMAWWAPRPEAIRNNFLEYRFAKPEMLQRAEVATKLLQFDDAKPDVLQVGDSSGLHGVQPPIVESYLGGLTYLNMSVATNLGYWGYYAIARRIMERSHTVKALVLYVTPAAPPRESLLNANDLMAPDLEREFVSPLHRWLHLPSLGVRREVTDWVYYLDGTFNQPDRPLIANSGYLMLRNSIAASNGWSRETDVPDDHIAGLFQMMRLMEARFAKLDEDTLVQQYARAYGPFGVTSRFDWHTLGQRTYIDIVLDRFHALATEFGAKLVVATNPAPASFQRPNYVQAFNAVGIDRELKRFAAAHPDVPVLGIEYWPDERFSVYSHIGTPYSVASSQRLGAFLAKALADLPRPSVHEPEYHAPERVVLDMTANPAVYGFADTETSGNRQFRRIRDGRDEGTIYARVDPAHPIELRIRVLNKPGDPVLQNVSVGVFGALAQRLPDAIYGDAVDLRFALPVEQTRRYGGWIELLLSTRGAATWQGNDLLPAATGPRLMIERMELGVEASTAARQPNAI